MRVIIYLECSKCKNRNYKTYKNKKTQSGRFEIKKFCPRCNEHVIHRESK